MKAIRVLVTAYAFVATLWAICLPTIRENNGAERHLFSQLLYGLLVVIGVIGACGAIAIGVSEPIDETPNALSENIAALGMVAFLITLACVGGVVENILSRLSMPDKSK